MKAKEPTLIVTFANTPDAIAMEIFCQQNDLPGRLIPIPGVLKAGCGLAWKTLPEEKEHFMQALANAGIRWEAMEILELWG